MLCIVLYSVYFKLGWFIFILSDQFFRIWQCVKYRNFRSFPGLEIRWNYSVLRSVLTLIRKIRLHKKFVNVIFASVNPGQKHRSNRSQMFFKIVVPKNFSLYTGVPKIPQYTSLFLIKSQCLIWREKTF